MTTYSSGPAISRAGSLEVFGRENGDNAMLGKRGKAATWLPSPLGWENLGGAFTTTPAVVAWDYQATRVDIFAPSPNQPLSMCHKSGQVGSWQPSPWDNSGIWHKWWDGQSWRPTQLDWEQRSHSNYTSPAAASWGPNRLDVFGVGANFRMAHKSWQGQDWEQPRLVWEDLGGYFCSRRPVVVAWAANRLDIFALGIDAGIYHKSWDGQMWWPSQEGWEHLGGGFFTPWRFTGPLAAVAFISGRLDVFCRGWDGAMYHKGWFSSPITEPQEWHPSGWAWEPLGGQFAL